jgi:hypothetical protein
MPRDERDEIRSIMKVLNKVGTFSSKNLEHRPDQDDPDLSTENKIKLKVLQKKFKEDVEKFDHSKIMTGLLKEDTYDKSIAHFEKRLKELNDLTEDNGRILVCLADGTVAFDSEKKDKNKWEYFKKKEIGENHLSRPSIMNCTIYEHGSGYEYRFSTTTMSYQIYYTHRIGGPHYPHGFIRYGCKD